MQQKQRYYLRYPKCTQRNGGVLWPPEPDFDLCLWWQVQIHTQKHIHELSVTPAESCCQCCWTASRTAELRPAAAPAKAAEFIIITVTGNSSSSLIPSALTAPGLTGIVGGRPRGWAHHLVETCIYFQGAVILTSCSSLQKCGGCQNNHIITSAVVSGPPSWSCFPSYTPNLSWRWVWFQQKVTTLSKKYRF